MNDLAEIEELLEELLRKTEALERRLAMTERSRAPDSAGAVEQ